jgi:hypothetical protein
MINHHDIIRIPDRSAPIAEIKPPPVTLLIVALVACAGWVIISSIIILSHVR